MAAPIAAVPDPQEEPVVLTVGGENLIVWPSDPSYTVALYAQEVEQQRADLEREMRFKRAQITRLQTDKAAEAERRRLGNPDRDFIHFVFDTYRRESGRRRCKLTPERFDTLADRLAEKYERPFLVMTAVGIAVNPFVIEGSKRNDFETAFKDGASVERYANRCPRERREQIVAEGGCGP